MGGGFGGVQAGGRAKSVVMGKTGAGTVTLLDLIATWDDFKRDHFKGVMTYEQYRKQYFRNRFRFGASSSTGAKHRPAGNGMDELSSPALSSTNPVLLIIADNDYSNSWVEQAMAKNYRDVVIQGTCDETAAPLSVFGKAWLQLQKGKLESRQFAGILKTFGGANCSAKEYSIPGLKFPYWSRPPFSVLEERILQQGGFLSREGTGGKHGHKHGHTTKRKADSSFKNNSLANNLMPMQLLASRKQHLGARFSQLQVEMEETVEELEAIRLLYVDADTRPGAGSGGLELGSTLSLDNLLFTLHTVKIYIYNPGVCLKALKCLWALTYDEEVRTELIVSPVIQILVRVVDIHISDAALCLYATGVISRVAWSGSLWRQTRVLSSVWNMLLEFLALHPQDEELCRLNGVALAALAVERGGAFGALLPLVHDLAEYYGESPQTVYALLGTVLQVIQIRSPEDPDEILRITALLLHTLDLHPGDTHLFRQCALGLLKLTSFYRVNEVLCGAPGLVNLLFSLTEQAMSDTDPYIVWLFITVTLNLLNTHGPAIKNLLFVHPKARLIYKLAVAFVAQSGEEYNEVLKQGAKELIHIFQSERQLMRQLIINEKKKEKL